MRGINMEPKELTEDERNIMMENILNESAINVHEYMEEKSPEAREGVVKPSHYCRWKIEPITFVMENELPFWKGNIVKYAVRAGYKKYDGLSELESEIADLEKVRRYAEMRINQLNGDSVL